MTRKTKWAIKNAEFILNNSDQIVHEKLDKSIANVQRRRRELHENMLLEQVKDVFTQPLKLIPTIITRKPRILIYDIETSYAIGKFWPERLYQVDIINNYEGVIEDYTILTIAWSWFGEGVVHVMGQDDFTDFVPGILDDRKLVSFIRDLYNEADIVIAHNGNNFDQRKCRARMIIHNLTPPKMPIELDTKLVAKQLGGFTANSLKALCKMLNLSFQKLDSEIEMWDGCRAGDMESWALMKQYNKGDIPTLNALYERFRPWIKNHPNLAQMFNDYDACPVCLEKNRLTHRGYKSTKVNTYRMYQCICGAWVRDRTPLKSKDKVKYVQ
jgi:hypothetical protein